MWLQSEERKQIPLSKILFLDSEKRNLLIYVILFVSWTLLELFYGLWINSIVLISNSFLSVFGCLGMIVNLASMILARRPSTRQFSYGYDRVETIGIFTNGAMLVFISLFIFFNSVERLLHEEDAAHVTHEEHHPEMSHEDHFREYHVNRTIGIAVIGLFINIIGFIYFKKHVHMRSECRQIEKQELSRSMYKLLSAHSFSTAAVVISSLFTSQSAQFDSIVSIIIGMIILKIAWPLCLDTGRVLLQATPISIKERVDRALAEIKQLKDVIEVVDHHFWTQSSGVFVGSLVVRVTQTANEEQIMHLVSSLFPNITHLTVQIEKEDWYKENQQV